MTPRPHQVFKYCPRCAKEVKVISPYILKCEGCDLNSFQSQKPANSIIIENEKGELLTAIRSIDPGKGKWDFPGGFTSLDENMEEALVRETKEELGINVAVDQLEYVGSFIQPSYEYQNISYQVLAFFYTAKLDSSIISEIKPADDVASVKFVKIEKINKDDTAFEVNLKALEAFKNLKNL